jgi:hypothetical protein
MKRATRCAVLTALACTVLAVTMLPAEAAWFSYVNREVGFSFLAPGEVKTEKGTYRSAMAGQRDAVVFRSVEDNVEFKVTVVDFAARTGDEAALIKEATATFQNNNKVLSDEDARIESDYGRKITIDFPNNGGRSMAAIYFKQGHLIQLQVTVPPNGDYLTPDLGRFIDSLAFAAGREESGATELKLLR